MRDTIAGIVPGWLLPLAGRLGWAVKPRYVPPGAPVHETVYRRFRLAEVTQCTGRGPYRPEALATHGDFNDGSPAAPAPAQASAPGTP